MDSRSIFSFVIIIAVVFCCSAVVLDQDSDAGTFDNTYTWEVGVPISDTVMGPGTTWEGSIPGITFETKTHGNIFVHASGTPTKAGTYTVRTYAPGIDTPQSTNVITVTGGSSSTTTNYEVSFSISSGSSYGSLNHTSITVPSGTTYTASGNKITFSNGSTVTATPNSSTSSYTYAFGSWSSTSGTVTAAKSITCTFTRTAIASSVTTPTITVGSAGSTITLTANTTCTWSISTNASKASLSTTSGTSVKVTPSNYGYIVVKATNSSNASYSATQQLNICRIVYNANGGFGTVPTTAYWIQSGSGSHSFSLTSGSLIKSVNGTVDSTTGAVIVSNYSQKGWNTSASATATVSSVSVAYQSSQTVYAVYNSSAYSTSTSHVAPTISVGSSGSTITLTSNYTNTTWSISYNASKAKLSVTTGKSVVVTPSDYGYIKVTAKCTADTTKTTVKTLNISRVVFNANGGSGSVPTTMYWIQTGAVSHNFSLPSASLTKSGYAFEGWNTSSTATTTIASKSISYRSSVTVYAVWSEISEDTLSFTSYPDSSCIIPPTITYRDDGSYVIA